LETAEKDFPEPMMKNTGRGRNSGLKEQFGIQASLSGGGSLKILPDKMKEETGFEQEGSVVFS
jgi:hypothetical protein